ncbi:hypothetical protein OO007_03665 [Cocleimonas sp. KMM 6892]|uniref:exosortase H-associated membrane protein n=1 Tax=unclassified Cocleimonas TaxID=2639732 RepID=UPI002DB837C9|nr:MULTISPECIES: exosortase H-associated membrane protein [unclassified Cocleimonas]MEB8431311.1 hypothetical protein [Cocleimonas sp. KMM 6892]MEC4713917.1 hypothetical protein [Cocleimonas sp. KMM 6895]MEC4743248.1 hypothetical protein [Cocleimonas sp. KMM 6896]
MTKESEQIISVKGFLLKILIWLPITFVVWYFLTPVILYVLSFLAKATLTLVAGQAVVDVNVYEHVLHIVTPFAAEKTNDVNQGQLVFAINAMKYGYGIALFIAMLLATPDKLGNKLQNLYIGILILLIVQVWGITFDTLQTLVFKLGMGIAETLNTTAFTRELIALGYQMGYLILPAVTPVLMWFVMYQNHLEKMAPKFAKIKKPKKKPSN